MDWEGLHDCTGRGHIGWKRGEVVPWAGLRGFRGRLGVGFRVSLAEVARPSRQNRSDCVRLFLPKTGQGRKASSPERAAANESIFKVTHLGGAGAGAGGWVLLGPMGLVVLQRVPKAVRPSKEACGGAFQSDKKTTSPRFQ